jgi:hypothetical protein
MLLADNIITHAFTNNLGNSLNYRVRLRYCSRNCIILRGEGANCPNACLNFFKFNYYLELEILGQHSWRDDIVPGFDSLTFPFQVM